MHVILVCIGKNIVEDVLIDGGSGVNIITEAEQRQQGLSKLSHAPFNLKMADGNILQSKCLIQAIRIHISTIFYPITLIIMDSLIVKSNYTMLLGESWL